MARIRTIKPDIWQSEPLGSVSIEAMLTFVGLITQADDDGRLRGSVGRLRATLFPYKPTLDTARVSEWLDELAARHLIQRYEADGRPYISLPGWHEHQRIAHPSSSDLPAPPTVSRTATEAEPAGSTSKGTFASAHENSGEVTSPPSGSGTGKEETSTAGEAPAMVARRLFTYWQETCKHPTAKFTTDRRRRVEARLREGYTEDEIRKGIAGAGARPFVNDSGKAFDDLELICRSGSKLESFIERSPGGQRAGWSSVEQARRLRGEAS